MKVGVVGLKSACSWLPLRKEDLAHLFLSSESEVVETYFPIKVGIAREIQHFIL